MHPLCRVWWPTNPHELGYYQSLFAACSKGTGSVAGAVAVAFFSRSGLPKPVLRQVREEVFFSAFLSLFCVCLSCVYTYNNAVLCVFDRFKGSVNLHCSHITCS